MDAIFVIASRDVYLLRYLGTVLDSTLALEIISEVIYLLDLVFLGEPIVFLPIMLAVGVRSSSSYSLLE